MAKFKIKLTKNSLTPFKQSGIFGIEKFIDSEIKGTSSLKEPLFWSKLGYICGQSGNVELAETAFNNALKIAKSSVLNETRLNIAIAYEQLQKHEKAIELLHSIPDNFSRTALIKANLLKDKGNVQESIPYFEKAVEKEPDFFPAYAGLLSALEAIRGARYDYWIKRAQSAFPNNPEVTYKYSLYCTSHHNFDQLADHDLSEDIEPIKNDVHITESAPSYEELKEAVHSLHILAKSVVDQDDEIIKSLNVDFSFDCQLSTIIAKHASNVGAVDLIEKPYSNICEDCKQWLKDEEGIDLDVLLATAHFIAGDKEKAREFVYSYDLDIKKNVTVYMLKWNLLEEEGKTNDALKVAEELRSLQPHDTGLLFNLGYLYTKSGDYEKSIACYEQFLKESPLNFTAYDRLALLNILSKDYNAARQWIQKLVIDSTAVIHDNSGDISANTLLFNQLEKLYDCLSYAEQIKDNALYYQNLVDNREYIAGFISDSKLIIERNVFNYQSKSPNHILLRELPDQMVSVIQERIPKYSSLPKEAIYELAEAERRISDYNSLHYTPEVSAYMKAIEIVLRENVFEEFKESSTINFIDFKQLETIDIHAKAKKLLSFMRNGHFLELGAMVHILDICNEKKMQKANIIRDLRDFIRNDLQKPELLSESFISSLREHVKKYRNEAVHREIFGLAEAQRVQTICYDVIETIAC